VASSEVASVSVVLLGREGAPRTQLRHALDELGAMVLHEGDLIGADCDALVALRPSVVLVNLDSGVEDALGDLEPLFDSPGVNVVFNEPESSAQLSGWDLARWARHLASKMLGNNDTVPPPPPGAEPLARNQFMPEPGAPRTPEQEVGDVGMERFNEEAAGSEQAVPASRNLLDDESDLAPSDAPPVAGVEAAPALAAGEEQAGHADAPENASQDEDENEIILLEGDSIVIDRVRDEVVPGETLEELEVTALDGLHDAETSVGDEVQLPAIERVEALHGGEAESDDFSLDLDDIESSLTLLDDIDDGASSGDDGNRESDGDSLALDLGFDLDFDKAPARSFSAGDDEFGEVDLAMDDDVAALAAQLDAMAPAPGEDAVADLDFSAAQDSFAAPADDEPAAIAGAAPAPAASMLGDLSLAPIDDGETEAAAAAPVAAPAAAAKTYDFSGLSLSLSPIDEDAEAPAASVAPPRVAAAAIADSGLSLEAMDDGDADATSAEAAPPISQMGNVADSGLSLAGVDDETTAGDATASSGVPVALAALDMPHATVATEDDLALFDDEEDEVDNTIHRVIVLAASIGGPDALRSFLGSLPEGFPALVLLCQHLDNGFFGRLSQQLQKVSKLPVRVADDGAGPVRPGQVVIVPSNARYRFDEDGSIEATPHAEQPRYQPCIDDLMRDVADRFGRRVTAIIFSGMAGDAIEGAVHVTVRGGEVWAQDPDSCVVSSMVDGARARGVVEYVGSPRELAEQCVRRFDRRVTEE
jgi:chemotaxis response regulator CheB